MTNRSHRLYHVLGNEVISHYAEGLGDVVRLARENSTYSPLDSDAVQYFAAHVYALEVAQGGEACVGDIAGKANEKLEDKAAPAPAPVTSTSPGESSTTLPAPAATSTEAAPAPAQVQATGNDCHTHADGTVHCGAH